MFNGPELASSQPAVALYAINLRASILEFDSGMLKDPNIGAQLCSHWSRKLKNLGRPVESCATFEL